MVVDFVHPIRSHTLDVYLFICSKVLEMFEPQKELNSFIKEIFWTIHKMWKAPKRG